MYFINYQKCQFVKEECEFVGHMVNKDGVRLPATRIADVVDFKKPTSIAELRTFLGMASYCKKFVSNFPEKASHLYELLKKRTEIYLDRKV